MLIKVFDLTAIAKKFAGSHVIEERYTVSDSNALLVGPEKFILTEYDSCHTIHDIGPDETIILRAGSLVPVALENGVRLIASASVSIPVELFLKETPVREEEFSHFINTQGDRKSRNYTQLRDSIRRIGLDLKDFPAAQ